MTNPQRMTRQEMHGESLILCTLLESAQAMAGSTSGHAVSDMLIVIEQAQERAQTLNTALDSVNCKDDTPKDGSPEDFCRTLNAFPPHAQEAFSELVRACSNRPEPDAETPTALPKKSAFIEDAIGRAYQLESLVRVASLAVDGEQIAGTGFAHNGGGQVLDHIAEKAGELVELLEATGRDTAKL